MRSLLADDLQAYITNREGVDQVTADECLMRGEAMDQLRSAHFRLDITQMVAPRPDTVMVMLEINAARAISRRKGFRAERQPRGVLYGPSFRRHNASSAKAGSSAQMKLSHTGTLNTLAPASPIGTPADGRSQNQRYGTALVAHHAGRAASAFFVGA
jgi:hypothetical protein